MGELSHSELRWHCPDIKTSKKSASLDKLVEQERFVKSFEAGMRVKDYNLFVANFDFDGSDDVIKSLIERFDERPVPDDIVCLQNFKEPNRPRVVYLPPGYGQRLKSDMSGLVDVVLHSAEKIVDDMNKELAPAFAKLQAIAKKNGITVEMKAPDSYKYAGIGVGEEVLKKFHEQFITPFINMVVSEKLDSKNWEDFAEQKIEERIGEELEKIRAKYADYKDLKSYFDEAREKLFAEPDPHDDECIHRLCEQLEVNVLVDNSKSKCAPVVFPESYQFGNIIGKIREKMTLSDKADRTCYRTVDAGAIIKANGGYLVLDLDALLEDPLGEASYVAIKRALKTKKVKIAHPYSAFGNSCDVKDIDVDVKVILKGSMHAYDVLCDYDDDFKDLFKAHADFDWSVDNSARNRQKYAALFDYVTKKQKLLRVDASGKAALIEHAAFLAENREKLSTDYDTLTDIVKEADLCARKDGRKQVCRADIEKILEEQFSRNTLWYEKEQEWIDKISLVQVSGSKVGQINGLVVNAVGGVEIGWPERLTASIGVGKKGIEHSDIEATFAGPVMTKATHIIDAYLLGKYCQDKPLQISAKVTFEQSYNDTDGDSASIATTCSLISEGSSVPIKQGIAVTGSMDRFGNVQPIGGANAKIAGFYDTCRQKGKLTGEQGVNIPYGNKRDLMLRLDIVNSVKDGKFHIYTAKTIDEAINRIFVGADAKEVHKRFDDKLYKLAMAYEKFGTESDE